MARWCRPDEIVQRGTAEVRILIENLYKFKDSGVKKFILEFSDKCWNAKSVNKLLKKLQDSGSMTSLNGKWPTSQCAF